jgi:putative spermidine/putrescine transport system ATP-binding protein
VESIYVGSGILSVIDLDDGARVTVLQPNVRGRSTDDERGQRVFVSWHESDVISLYPPAGGG